MKNVWFPQKRICKDTTFGNTNEDYANIFLWFRLRFCVGFLWTFANSFYLMYYEAMV